MLAVKEHLRGRGIATQLVEQAIHKMIEGGADEVCLETEVTNPGAMKLYENLGFLRYIHAKYAKRPVSTDTLRAKRLHRYYLNANDAFRYKLPLR